MPLAPSNALTFIERTKTTSFSVTNLLTFVAASFPVPSRTGVFSIFKGDCVFLEENISRVPIIAGAFGMHVPIQQFDASSAVAHFPEHVSVSEHTVPFRVELQCTYPPLLTVAIDEM